MKLRSQHGVQGVFVFVLLALFALLSTLMVLLGAQMYRATVARSESNNADRVLTAYVRGMIRSMDSADAVSVEQLDGVTALGLRETIDDEVYVTWLYPWQGCLWEQFTELENPFSPESGTQICPVSQFLPRVQDEVLTVLMIDGENRIFTVKQALRCP